MKNQRAMGSFISRGSPDSAALYRGRSVYEQVVFLLSYQGDPGCRLPTQSFGRLLRDDGLSGWHSFISMRPLTTYYLLLTTYYLLLTP